MQPSLEEMMKLALSTNMAEYFLDFASRKAECPLELHPRSDGNLVACKEEFELFEEGHPRIEKVRDALRGYIPGPLEIWVQERPTDEFISLVDFAIRCERGMHIWRDDSLREDQRSGL